MSHLNQSPTVPSRFYRLERLLHIRSQLIEADDFAKQMQIIISAACEISRSAFSAIFVLEPETGFLKLLAAPDKYYTTLRLLRLPLQGNLAGQCVQQAKSLIVNTDASIRPQNKASTSDSGLAFEQGPAAAVPLTARQTTLGVLLVAQKSGEAHYTEEDVSLLESLAFHAALLFDSFQLSDEIRRATERLHDFDRMKADFIAITSHELRTPLGLIMGHANLLVESLPPGKTRNEAQVIADQAARVAERVEELSHASLDRNGQALTNGRRVNLSDLLNDAINIYAELAERKNIQIIRDYPENASLMLQGDAEKLILAFSNLLKNALTFTDAQGHILVSAEKLPGYLRICIVDDGIGIPEDDQHRIFERFYQVEDHLTRRHGGMGLGLAVAKTMVEMHGGEIWVESRVGQGSNFSILLPDGSVSRRKKQAAFISEPE